MAVDDLVTQGTELSIYMVVSMWWIPKNIYTHDCTKKPSWFNKSVQVGIYDSIYVHMLHVFDIFFQN